MLKSWVQNTNIKHVSTKRRKKRKSSCTCVNIASANKASIARLADESPIPYVDYMWMDYTVSHYRSHAKRELHSACRVSRHEVV